MPKSPTREAIAAEVRASVARSQVKQADLALAIGMSQAALSERLRGLRAFDTDQLVAIADHLGVEVLDLIPTGAAA